MARETLTKMPLVEAMVEFRWALEPTASGGQSDRAYPFYVGSLQQSLKSTLPHLERLPAADFPDEMTPHVVKYRFRPTADTWPVAQIGPGVASYNTVGSYDWDTFEASSRDFYIALNEAYNAATDSDQPPYSQFILKYINAVELADNDDPRRFIEQNLGVKISLPPAVDESSNGTTEVLNISVSVPLEYAGTSGSLTIGVGEKDGKSAIIWDTSITGLANRSPDAVGNFPAWLEAAHVVAENWFFALIDGNLYDRFK